MDIVNTPLKSSFRFRAKLGTEISHITLFLKSKYSINETRETIAMPYRALIKRHLSKLQLKMWHCFISCNFFS